MFDVPEKISPVRKWLSRLVRLFFVLFVILAIFITILANMGGASQNLKESAEGFIGDIFNGRGSVQKLVRLSFFPMVGMDVEGVQVFNDITVDPEVIASFDKARMYMDFWDVVFKNARFRTFFVEGGYLKKDMYAAKTLKMERAFVDHDQEKSIAKILANGTYDKYSWKMEMGIDILSSGSKPEYELGDQTPVSLEIGEYKISGVLTKDGSQMMKVKEFKIAHGDQELSGDIYISLLRMGLMKLRGGLSFDKGETPDFDLDVLIDFSAKPLAISGKVSGQDFKVDDLWGDQSLRQLLSGLYDVLRDKKIYETRGDAFAGYLSSMDLDLEMSMKNITLADGKAAGIDLRLDQRGGDLSLQNVKGVVSGVDVDIPAIVILQKEKAAQDTPRVFYALATAQAVKPSIFDVVNKDIRPSVFSGQEQVNMDCLSAVFSLDKDSLIFDRLDIANGAGQDEKTISASGKYDLTHDRWSVKTAASKAAPVIVLSASVGAFAAAVFDIPEGEVCKAMFKAEEKAEKKTIPVTASPAQQSNAE
jgi:hypothetical protein